MNTRGNKRTNNRTNNRKIKKRTIMDTNDDIINENCTICLGTNEKQGLLECGHYFCYDCIDTWFIKNKSCPQCRKKDTKIYACANAFQTKTSLLDCLAFFKYELIPINQLSSDNVNRCFYCKTYYGCLYNSISTTNKDIKQEFFCSRCVRQLSYDPTTQKIKGNTEMFLDQLQKLSTRIMKCYLNGMDNKVRLETNNQIIDESYDFNTIGNPNYIPSNYELIGLFYRKSPDELKLTLIKVFEHWDVEKGHYINETEAERLYQIFKSSVPNIYDAGDLVDFFAKTVGPFLIRWDKCTDFQNIFLKGMISKAYGDKYTKEPPSIENLIRFLYCLRKGVFKYLKWGYNTDHMMNIDFMNIINK